MKANQNPLIEWQANEGAAELIVPYKKFIPDFLHIYNPILGYGDIFVAIASLSGYYGVSDMVIQNRIKNLNYEIYQVASGVHIDSVVVLSQTLQKRLNITVPDWYDSAVMHAVFGEA